MSIHGLEPLTQSSQNCGRNVCPSVTIPGWIPDGYWRSRLVCRHVATCPMISYHYELIFLSARAIGYNQNGSRFADMSKVSVSVASKTDKASGHGNTPAIKIRSFMRALPIFRNGLWNDSRDLCPFRAIKSCKSLQFLNRSTIMFFSSSSITGRKTPSY